MKHTPTVIPLFYACDEAFANYTVVSLTSVRNNASPDDLYHVFILHSGLSEQAKAKIRAVGNGNERFSIRFQDVTECLDMPGKHFPIRDYYSKTTYFRMFIADLFPEYRKAVYIDSDTIVRADIGRLYETELTDDDYLAACKEQVMVQTDVFGRYTETVLGIDRRRYFNAGVLLLNLTAFRELRLLEAFARLLDFYTFSVTQDEDYLNVLCKDHVRWLDQRWNTELFGELSYPIEEAYVLHFIMTSKPWRYPDAPGANLFWAVAQETPVYAELREELRRYTDEERARDRLTGVRLQALAQTETERDDHYVARLRAGQDPSRVAILEKIDAYERDGRFAEDVEDDPPTKPLLPDQIDYYHAGRVAKWKTKLAFAAARKFVLQLLNEKKMIIREIRGIEHMARLEEGAVITCNHFNAFDSFAIQLAYEASGQTGKTFYRVIREGNYTSFPGFYGFLMRNCNTLPLSSNLQTMKKFTEATGTLLRNGHFVLIYPEQSMWWNYRKPKPMQKGAFIFAVRNGVPVLPCFITMKDSTITGDDGFPVQEYTIHISEPLYPDPALSYAQNVQSLMDRNYAVWKSIYESAYGIPLSYEPFPAEQTDADAAEA